MRTFIAYVILLSATFSAVGASQVTNSAFTADVVRIERTRFKTEEGLIALRNQMDELDQKWLSMDANSRAELFVKAAEALRSSNFGNAREQYEEEQAYALRGLKNAVTDDISLEREMKLLSHLRIDMATTDDPRSYAQERTLKSNFWIHGWRRLEREASAVYPTPEPVLVNVIPPAERDGTRHPAGVSPEAIKDPQARRQYEGAIRENNDKAQLNLDFAKHKLILSSKEGFTKGAERFFVEAYSKGPQNIPELNSLLAGIQDKEAKKRIEQALMQRY